MNRLSWDEYGLAIAQVVAERAACTRRQVGAVIMTPDHFIVATGYNGTPSGEINCSDGGCPRGLLTYDQVAAGSNYSNCKGKHAEHNAIALAGTKTVGSTLYCTTEPCYQCSEEIEAAGISRVVFSEKLKVDNPQRGALE